MKGNINMKNDDSIPKFGYESILSATIDRIKKTLKEREIVLGNEELDQIYHIG